MSSAVQFIKSNPILKPVIVVSGRNYSLINYCIELILLRLNKEKVVIYRSALETPIKRLLDEISFNYTYIPHLVCVYRDVERVNHAILEWFADNPTKNITLIVTAGSIRRADGERWISSRKHVLYIDCANLTEEHVMQFIQFNGLSELDAKWLYDNTSGDLNIIIQFLEMLEVFDNPPADIIRKLVFPILSRPTILKDYDIIFTEDASVLYRQVFRRLIQLIMLASGYRSGVSIYELSKRVDMEPFQIKRLMPILKGSTPISWFERLISLISAGEFLKANLIGSVNYIEEILNVLSSRMVNE